MWAERSTSRCSAADRTLPLGTAVPRIILWVDDERSAQPYCRLVFKRHPPPDELADLPFVYGAACAAADNEQTAADVTVAVITVALVARRSGRGRRAAARGARRA